MFVRNLKIMKIITITAFMLICFCQSAMASPFDLYGLSSRSIGMGGAMTAAARDYSALFYNPARMGYVPPSMGVHFVASFDHVYINRLDRPAGYDVPDINGIDTMPTSGLKPRKNTNDEPNNFMLTAGIVHDFGLYWLRAGLAVSLPVNMLAKTSIKYADEREQYFSNQLDFQLMGTRAGRPSFLGGIAFRPVKWFGFGASVNVFGNFVATTHMFIPDAGNLYDVNLTMDVAMKYDAAIIAGLHFDPLDWFGIGITFRDRSWFGADFTNELQLGLRSHAEEVFSYGFSFTPRTLALGLRFDAGDWTVATDASYVRWSEFRNQTDMAAESGFDDTYTVRLGVEGRVLEWLEIRFGAGWLPSPVPRQDGRTNYVDNDKIESSVGASFILPWVKGLALDMHVQFITLLKRQTRKDPNASDPVIDEFPDTYDRYDNFIEESADLQTNNPGWPGYDSGGFIGTVGLGVSYQFQ